MQRHAYPDGKILPVYSFCCFIDVDPWHHVGFKVEEAVDGVRLLQALTKIAEIY